MSAKGQLNRFNLKVRFSQFDRVLPGRRALWPARIRQHNQPKMVKFYKCKIKSCIYKVRTKELLDHHMKAYHGRNNYKWCFFCRYTTKVQVGQQESSIVQPNDEAQCDRKRPLIDCSFLTGGPGQARLSFRRNLRTKPSEILWSGKERKRRRLRGRHGHRLE